jgi:hypothetical protein
LWTDSIPGNSLRILVRDRGGFLSKSCPNLLYLAVFVRELQGLLTVLFRAPADDRKKQLFSARIGKTAPSRYR